MAEADYEKLLSELDGALGMYPEENLELLEEYKALADLAVKGASIEAANALLTIAYTINERISAAEDLAPYYTAAASIFERHNLTEERYGALEQLAWHLSGRGEKEKGVKILEEVYNEQQESREGASLLLLESLASLKRDAGDIKGALALRERALKMWAEEDVEPGTPSVAIYDASRLETANLYSLLERHTDAEPLLRAVLEHKRSSFIKLHPEGRWHTDVVGTAIELSRCLFRQARTEEAIKVIVDEMPEETDIKPESVFAPFARSCFQMALRDLTNGREPSQECDPQEQISKGFVKDEN
ncbi:MAG: hypothetical protein J5J00_10755 [Deltaproteobacteria bacterium]|nr:hypothetical protein [Deltaproteobacteria bacterium]